MEAILNVVLPVFAIMASGYLVGRAGILGQDSSQALNGFVYYVALPALFFGSLASTPLDHILYWDFIAAFGGGLLIVFLGALVIARFAFPDKGPMLLLHALCSIFSNTGYMGVPLLLLAFGQEGVLPAVVTTVINGALVIVAGVLLLEIMQAQGHGGLTVARKALGGVVRNPLFLSAGAGLLWSWGGYPLPRPVETFTEIVGAAAGPCALFAIGLFMVGKSLRAGLGEVLWICLLKLVVLPAVVAWLAFVVFDLEPLWAKAAVVQAALPIGALAFVLASSYGVYVQRATSAILISTVVSVVSLSLLFALLGVG